ncbi:2-phospho-L-lactate transferase CofD family protein, partial [Desulfovibrio sp. OttesenSCG-928-F20]|nr:2-phospho-L-lactate transferase CofD family protein [Desulfovibrio sp. OttesenSCG-928-F20]
FISLVRGSHPLMRQIPEPVNGILREHLAWFALRMPENFPLAGANVGNLVLTAGYLRNKRRLGPVMALFSRMVRARGMVRPVVDANAHLAVRLASGEVIVGQHRFTGKERGRVPAPIEDIWLTASEDSPKPLTDLGISPRTARLISGAGALCYPVGSFYSSVVANLLPSGVGRAVAQCQGRKIFVPNLGDDPELAGHSLLMQVERLLKPLLADAPGARPVDCLSHVLVDEDSAYPGGIPEAELQALGITVVRQKLVPQGKILADARLLAQTLLGKH